MSNPFLSMAPIAALPVKIGKQEFKLRSVSVTGVAVLLRRFVGLFEVLESAKKSKDFGALISVLMTTGDDVMAAVLAAGLGRPGDDAVEELVKDLSLTDQAALLKEVAERTMPDGIGPFVERVTALMASFKAVEQAAPAAVKSGRFKVRSRR